MNIPFQVFLILLGIGLFIGIFALLWLWIPETWDDYFRVRPLEKALEKKFPLGEETIFTGCYVTNWEVAAFTWHRTGEIWDKDHLNCDLVIPYEEAGIGWKTHGTRNQTTLPFRSSRSSFGERLSKKAVSGIWDCVAIRSKWGKCCPPALIPRQASPFCVAARPQRHPQKSCFGLRKRALKPIPKNCFAPVKVKTSLREYPPGQHIENQK